MDGECCSSEHFETSMFILASAFHQLIEERTQSGLVIMRNKKARSQRIVAGLFLVVMGAAMAICSMPVFSYTRDELHQVQRSEIIMNYSFNIHQSQDKMVQVQLSTGQKLNILATGSGSFNFSIVNFTSPSQVIQPDQPDQIYLSLDNTSFINTTWSPTIRSAQLGNYYLVFLARNTSSDFPLQINADVTKTWMDIQIIGVPYQNSLIDSGFVYIGLGITASGAVVLLVTLYPKRWRRYRRRARSSAPQ
jgi:hypothetical protein